MRLYFPIDSQELICILRAEMAAIIFRRIVRRWGPAHEHEWYALIGESERAFPTDTLIVGMKNNIRSYDDIVHFTLQIYVCMQHFSWN